MNPKNVFPTLFLTVLALFFYSCQEYESQAKKTSSTSLELPFSTQSEDALNAMSQGLQAMDLGNRELARLSFDKAIALDPEFAAAYVYRSFCSRSTQEFAKDVKMANEKNKNNSKAEQLLVELDNAYLAGDVDKRLAIAKSMVKEYPEVARAHIILGQAQEDLNDKESARKSFKKSIELNPTWTVGYSLLGSSYIFDEPKDLAKAEVNMQKVVELQPNESRAHIALGDVYRAQQNLEKARESYVKAGRLDSNDSQAFSKAGHANSFLGKFDEARKDFEKSLSLSNFPAADLNFTAFTHLYEGNHAQGLAWLKEQAMNMDKFGLEKDRLLAQELGVLNNCMWMAFHLDDTKELKSLYAMLQPKDLENTKGLDTKEAMMKYSARTNFRNGLIAATEGLYAAANEKAEAQKNDLVGFNDPNKLEDYHFLKGEIAMREGNFKDAVSHFGKSDLDDMYSKYKFAMANKKAGNYEKASQLFNEISIYNFNDVGYALIRKEVQDMLAKAS